MVNSSACTTTTSTPTPTPTNPPTMAPTSRAHVSDAAAPPPATKPQLPQANTSPGGNGTNTLMGLPQWAQFSVANALAQLGFSAAPTRAVAKTMVIPAKTATFPAPIIQQAALQQAAATRELRQMQKIPRAQMK